MVARPAAWQHLQSVARLGRGYFVRPHGYGSRSFWRGACPLMQHMRIMSGGHDILLPIMLNVRTMIGRKMLCTDIGEPINGA